MSDYYLGEIRVFPFDWAPANWALCAGQSMSVSQNQALAALLGTFYGGDGKTTFNLPDLRGRTPVGAGPGAEGIPYKIGDKAGSETVTLTATQMASHTHYIAVSTQPGTTNDNTDAFWGQAEPVVGKSVTMYGPPPATPAATVTLDATGITVMPTGGNQPHSNIQPFLTLNYCIAIRGIFPQRADF